VSSSSSTADARRPRRITGYHQDEERHWVAELECGHQQHVRHEPPLVTREWVTTAEGRAEHLGTILYCLHCATTPCDQCGAMGAGVDCLAAFHGLLAYENENPPAFAAVHHITVPAFYLQHPRGYKRETLGLWRQIIADVLAGKATQRDMYQQMRSAFDGKRRVQDESADVPDGWPRRWSLTVQDAFDPEGKMPSVDSYVESARRWVAAVRDDLALRE
jgi:hypothetical protein